MSTSKAIRGTGGTIARWISAISVAFSICAAGPAVAGIASTKHNLSTTGTQTNHVTTGSNQICVFCHTPHGSDTSAPVPLWNKKLPSNSYQTYDTLNTASLDGEVLAVGSVSLACLSCHDGTQAMDNMMNAPGSGGYNAAGARATVGNDGATNYTWANVGANGLMPAGVTNLGTDLRNDHPIGIQYCGGGLSGSGTTLSGTCADGDFINGTADGSGRLIKTATINSNQVFWVEVNGATGRQKDDISLYTRTFTAGAGPSVECASCHDPHVDAKGTDGIAFMRVTTSGSQICLSCHVK